MEPPSSHLLFDTEAGTNVKVVARVRPLNHTERQRGDPVVAKVHSERTVSVSSARLGKECSSSFEFDRVLGEGVQQPEFFETSGVRQMLDAALEGYGATVFAYGQTGSGKTHTMFGSQASDCTDGIIPRAIEYVCARARQIGASGSRCTLRGSFCEIYNEQVYDLLNPQSKLSPVDGTMQPVSLNIRQQANNRGFLIENLFVVSCEDSEDMSAVVAEGVANRRVSNHAMNKDSSRSHSIFTIEVDVMAGRDGSGSHETPVKHGKICLVDLAGSERLRDTHSTGQVLKEAGYINGSLFVLGKVISALSEGETQEGDTHLPFRDSKLTMLLKDCLGGRSLALMVACVSPSLASADESVSTLSYASRANRITNYAVAKVGGDPKDEYIASLVQQIAALKAENQQLKRAVQEGPGRGNSFLPSIPGATGGRAGHNGGRHSVGGGFSPDRAHNGGDPGQQQQQQWRQSDTAGGGAQQQQAAIQRVEEQNAQLRAQLNALQDGGGGGFSSGAERNMTDRLIAELRERLSQYEAPEAQMSLAELEQLRMQQSGNLREISGLRRSLQGAHHLLRVSTKATPVRHISRAKEIQEQMKMRKAQAQLQARVHKQHKELQAQKARTRQSEQQAQQAHGQLPPQAAKQLSPHRYHHMPPSLPPSQQHYQQQQHHHGQQQATR